MAAWCQPVQLEYKVEGPQLIMSANDDVKNLLASVSNPAYNAIRLRIVEGLPKPVSEYGVCYRDPSSPQLKLRGDQNAELGYDTGRGQD